MVDPVVQRTVAWLYDKQIARDNAQFTPARNTNPLAINDDWQRLAPIDFIWDSKGGGNEHHFTGTGFLRFFSLRYNVHRYHFPVMALARYLGSVKELG